MESSYEWALWLLSITLKISIIQQEKLMYSVKARECEIGSEGMKMHHKKHQAAFLWCYTVEPCPNQIIASSG